MASVQYNVLAGGNLNIVPSGNKVFIDDGDTAATLTSANIDVTDNISIDAGAALFTKNDLTGSITLNGSGTINASANKITDLTELTSTKIQSGAVIIDANNLSNVKKITSDTSTGVKIESNTFKVESAILSGATLTTMTSDIVKLGTGSMIDATSVTTTDVNASGTSTLGGVAIASNNITTVGTLDAGEIRDATGTAHMTGGVVTAVTGNIPTVNSTTINNSGTITSAELTDGTIVVASGNLTGATSISGSGITMSSGIIGHSTLTGSDEANSQIKTSKVIVGAGIISQTSTVAALTGFSTVSSSTLTTAAGTNIINGNVSTDTITCASNLTVTSGTATIGSVAFSSGTISSLTEVSSIRFKSGTMEMYTSGTGGSTTHKIVGVDELSSSTITSGGITVTGATNSVVGLLDLSSTRATIGTLTSTKVVSGLVTLEGNNMTNLSTTTSETFKTKSTGGIEITSAADAHSISGVKSLTMASGGSITCGTMKLDTDNNIINGVSEATVTGKLKVGDIVVQTNNISNVSDVNCATVTSSGNVTAGTFTNNNFTVTHDAGTSVTTARSNVFTTNLGSGGITINNTTVSGITDVNTVNITATGLISGDTLAVSGASTIEGLLTTSASINNTGSITSSGKIVGKFFEASDTEATSVIKGHLLVEGDLQVVNSKAQVIELTHEKMSTQDPVLEFNKILDGNTAPSKTVMNVDFGFVNVCYDGTNKKTAGLIGDMSGEHYDVVFKFFHSGDYTDGNNQFPAGIVYAPIQCGNVVSDGKIQVGSTAPIGTEKIATDGGVKCANLTATGITASGTVNLTSTGDTITSAGKITTLSFQTTNFTQTSDARKKENVKTIDDALTNIEKLNPVTFDWKDSKKSDIGFIAQEVREVFPELVQESDDGHLSVAYTGIVSPLVRAIQQQQEVIRKLEERIAKLEQ